MKNKNMKNNLIITILAVVLLISMVSCNRSKIDYTTDIPNAVELINNTIKNDDTKEDNEKINFSADIEEVALSSDALEVSNITEKLPIKNISVDGNIIRIQAIETDDNMISVETMIVIDEEGLFVITYGEDGYDYQYHAYSMNDINNVFSSKNVLDIALTEEDILYDADSGYFIIENVFIESFLNNIKASIQTDNLDADTKYIYDLILTMINYTCKFKVSEDNFISDFEVVGTMKDDSNINVINLTYSNDGNIKNMNAEYSDPNIDTSVIVRYSESSEETVVDVTVDADAKVQISGRFNKLSESKYKASLLLDISTGDSGMNDTFSSIIPENFDFEIAVTVNVSKADIKISDDMQKEMDKAKSIGKISAKMEEKYAGEFRTEEIPNCGEIEIYDDEYDVFVKFDLEIMDEYYEYSGVDIERDTDNRCLATIDIFQRMVLVKEHSKHETMLTTLEAKYSHDYTSKTNCESILVYDSEHKVYVLFEEDFFNAGKYEFEYYYDKLNSDYCIGSVDTSKKVLNVSEHSPVEQFRDEIKGKEFVVSGATDDCSCVCVLIENSDTYALFYNLIGKYSYSGTASWIAGCEADLNKDTNTLTIQKHHH